MMQPNTPARDPLADIGNFIFLRDEPQPADAIFITGGAYPEVGERAAALWRQGLAPVILPSGRYSVHDGRFIGAQSLADRYPGPYATEWEFLRDVCVKNGVACRFSVVDCIGEDAVASCKRLAESAGVPLYVRKYIADS